MSSLPWLPTAASPGWEEDENGTLRWKQDDWSITIYPETGWVDVTGPDQQDIDVYPDEGNIRIEHEVDYDGSVAVLVPIAVLVELMRIHGISTVPKED